MMREEQIPDFVREIAATGCDIRTAYDDAHVIADELSMVIEKQLGPEGMRQADAFFRRAAIGIEPVTVEQGHLAREAFIDFEKGRHRAGLNFGDCFAYALARDFDEPLLFKGNDFTETDIRSAA